MDDNKFAQFLVVAFFALVISAFLAGLVAIYILKFRKNDWNQKPLAFAVTEAVGLTTLIASALFFGSIGAYLLTEFLANANNHPGICHMSLSACVSNLASDLFWVYAIPFWMKTCAAFAVKIIIDRIAPSSSESLARWAFCLILGFVAVEAVAIALMGSPGLAAQMMLQQTVYPIAEFIGGWMGDMSFPIRYAIDALDHYWNLIVAYNGNQFIMANEMPKFFSVILLVSILSYPFQLLAGRD